MTIIGLLRDLFELGETRARLLPMEGLRGFAVSLVFLQHFTTQFISLFHPTGASKSVAEALSSYGNQGVELFFVLSGYLIYGLLIRRPSIWRFMRRRAQRIYPAFFVAFVIGVAIAVTIPGSQRIPSDPVDATLYLAANLLLLPGLFPIEPVFAVAWSLSYEIFYYWATALLVTVFTLNQRSRAARILTIVAFAALLTGLSVAHLPNVPVRMMPFFAGMLLFELSDFKTSLPLALVGLLAPLLAFLTTSVLRIPFLSSQPAAEWLHTVAFFALCFSCFRVGNAAARLFTWTPLRWLGNMSYSYYLVHGFVVKAAMEVIATTAAHAIPTATVWLLALPVFGLTLGVSACLFLVVERPYSLNGRSPRRTFKIATSAP